MHKKIIFLLLTFFIKSYSMQQTKKLIKHMIYGNTFTQEEKLFLNNAVKLNSKQLAEFIINNSQKEITLKGHEGSVSNICQLQNNMMASSSTDNTIKVWDLSNHSCIATLKGHTNLITKLISTNDNKLISCSRDNTIKVWDLKNLNCLATLNGHLTDIQNIITYDSNKLISSSNDGLIIIWDLDNFKRLASITIGIKGKFSENKIILYDKNKLIFNSFNCSIQVLDLNTFKLNQKIPLKSRSVDRFHLLSDNKLVLYADKTISIWDLEAKKYLPNFYSCDESVMIFHNLPNNKFVGITYTGNHIVYNLKKQHEYESIQKNSDSNIFKIRSIQNKYLISGGSSHIINISDLYNNKLIANLKEHKDSVVDLCILPNNKFASSSHDNTIKIWHPDSIVYINAIKELVDSRPDIKKEMIQLVKSNFKNISSEHLKIFSRKYTELIEPLAQYLIDEADDKTFEFCVNIGTIREKLFRLIIKKPLFNYNTKIDLLYEKLNTADKNELEKVYFEQLRNINTKITFASFLKNKFRFPKFIHEKKEPNITHSKSHMITNFTSFDEALEKSELKNEKIRNFILKIYEQEKKEYNKGNYTFSHARSQSDNYASDIYKQLWNIRNNQTIQDDYTFVKYLQPNETASEIKSYETLSLSYALLGNCNEITGISELAYNTRSYRFGGYSQKNIFELLNLSELYNKYENELTELKNFHAQASPSNEILLISIPKNKVDIVTLATYRSKYKVFINKKEERNIQIILDTLKNNPRTVRDENGKEFSNFIEFSLPISKVADPKGDIKIYSFYFQDNESEKKYKEIRDKLFKKIKQDYLTNQVTDSQVDQQAMYII